MPESSIDLRGWLMNLIGVASSEAAARRVVERLVGEAARSSSVSAELRERLADMLAENDQAGPGPVSRGEYLADADALIALITQDRPSVSVEPVATLYTCPTCGAIDVRGFTVCHGSRSGTEHPLISTVPFLVFSERDMQAAQEALETSRGYHLSTLADAMEQRDDAERERDEAREALRALLWLCDQHPGRGFRSDRAVKAAREIVEGMERTHAATDVSRLDES